MKLGVAVASLLFAVAGCGGGGKTSSSSSTTAPPAPAHPAAVPTYQQVKQIALADPALKTVCAGRRQDLHIEGSAPGEQYRRFICGYTEVFDYSAGKHNFVRDFPAIQDEAQQPIWVLGKEAFVEVPTILASKGFAAKIKKQCGCGTVVAPKH